MVKRKQHLKKPTKSESKRDREPNLFESLYNRKKFDILGKKVKDEQRKRGRARSEGIHKRKNTLLVEYKQRHTANDFIDRRFGEGDEALDESDRAIARFQKQRIKELAGYKFNLAELDDAEQLTHLGASLAEIDDRHLGNSFAAADDDDDDADLNPQMVHDLHFGGGFMKREGRSSVEEAVEQPRSKKEVMEEIIAKSKAFKAEKSKQRETDLDATEALDRDLADLMSGGALHALIRPKRSKHAHKAPAEQEDAAYDTLRRELVFEAKAKVGERTKTAEEVTEAEHKRLHALEMQQQKRMLDENEGESIAVVVDAPEGGYAARRAKRHKLDVEATGDTLEDDFQIEGDDSQDEEEEEEDGARPTLDQRRIQRASGDHPLQERFREVSRQLLEKHGVRISKGGGNDQSDTEAEESCDEESADGGNSRDQEADDNALADLDDAVTNDLPHGDLPSSYPKPAVQDRGNIDLPGSVAGTSAPSNLGRDLPLYIAVPQTYDQFAKLVSGKRAEELGLAIQRIRHNLQLAAENKHSSQVLYGILVQHFANRAGLETPPLEELDVLTAQLLDLTPSVPLYAATVALARLKRLQESLSSADGARAWPSHRHLLLLKLWATIFPPSDRRHAVLAPAALLTASHLAICPVNSLQDAVAGIFLSSLGLHMAATTQRVMPEPLIFATQLLYSALDRPQGPAPPRTIDFSLKLVPQGGWHAAIGAVELLKLGSTSAPGTDDAVVKASCLKAAIGLIRRAAELFGEAESLPELLTPALHLLQELGSAHGMPQEIVAVQQQAQAFVAARITDVLAARRPLRKVKLKREMKQYNPRFEDEYAAGKSYDPDRDRAEARKLKRMLTKERRGAMQELRKDANFLGEQIGKDKEVQKAELKSSLRSNSAWLQKLEQDFRSGGQGGMWKKGGK